MALENARLYEEARSLADRDPLTGFYNHRYLHERFGEEVVRAQRTGQPLSVLMLDLDDFKLVNDTFGHLFGDRVLAWTAELIRSTLRASDIPARYGGDEFAILLPDTGADAAHHAAERIRAAFAAAGVRRRRPQPGRRWRWPSARRRSRTRAGAPPSSSRSRIAGSTRTSDARRAVAGDRERAPGADRAPAGTNETRGADRLGRSSTEVLPSVDASTSRIAGRGTQPTRHARDRT